MKKIMLTLLISLLSHGVMASEIYCGLNLEKIPGSHSYNKLIFWEKATPSQSIYRFVLPDGTLIKPDPLSSHSLDQVVDGSLAAIISYPEKGTQLLLAQVKRNEKNEISYTNVAISVSSHDTDPTLIANDALLLCREM